MATKATTNTTGGSAPVSDLLDAFADVVAEAEAHKAATTATPEAKAVKQARNLIETLGDLEAGEAILADLQAFVGSIAPTVEVDRQAGNDAATAIGGLIAAAQAVEIPGFDPEAAATLLERWKAATGRRARGEAGGGADPKQAVPCPVRVTFAYPDGSDVKLSDTITHASTWSSVSAEITKRAMALAGLNRGEPYTRPAEAAAEWKAARASIIDGGAGGVVTVPTPAGDMVATVEAVR